VKIKVKFAVIGCGHIGKRHAEMISAAMRKAKLVAALRCEVAKEEVGSLTAFDVPFFQRTLSRPCWQRLYRQVEVVNVCTPNGLHAPN
jgi:predicted dehydrogenase